MQFVAQTYNKSLSGVADVCYLATNGRVKALADGGTIKGLRAYFIVPEAQTQAQNVKLYFNHVADGIDGIDEVKPATAVYNLAGQRVTDARQTNHQSLRRGIYIVGGRKVVVK